MLLSKRQKICSVILVVALGALIADRALLNPKSAPAEAPPYSDQASGESVDGAAEPSAAGDSQCPTIKLSRQLETLCPDDSLGSDQVRDAFCLPESWLAEVYPGRRPTSGQDAATMFANSHRLSAVAAQNQVRGALVDDHFLIIGQQLDGFKLIAVDEGSATFEAGGKQVVLKLTNDR